MAFWVTKGFDKLNGDSDADEDISLDAVELSD